jgi:tol-pal system protein YbgF
MMRSSDGFSQNTQFAKARLVKLRNTLFAAAFIATAAAPPARAQTYERPPADLADQGYGARTDAANVVRTDRLENQVRGLTGQVEQLQFQVRRLEDQLRKFQADVDQRLQDSAARGAARPVAAGPQKRTDLADPVGAPEAQVATSAAPAVAAPSATIGADGRRRDAFDPNAQPTAPGAPRPLGSAESASKPVARNAVPRPDPTGPLDLTPPGLRGAPSAAPAPASSGAVASLDPNAGVPAAPPADPVKAAYDAAAEQLKTQRYDAAQQEFSVFLEKNPHSRLVAPAIYHLGESYYYQNRHREAAEQFLKIATDYSKSPIAPDAMVKLGVSLNALGAKEQACAFFSELPRKYPNASAAEKTAAAREAKKASC